MSAFLMVSLLVLSADPTSIREPAAGVAWAVGSTHVVEADGKPDGTVSLSTDGGKTWAKLGEAKAGSFRWTVGPGPESASARLRLEPKGQGTPIESAAFRIIPSQEVKEYRWVSVQPKARFAPRDGAGALVFRDRMWFLGGWNPGDRKNFPMICNNEVWSSADGKAWDLVKPNTFFNASFDPKSDWEGRHTAGYAVYKEKMWIVGGDANQKHYQNDVWHSSEGIKWTLANPDRSPPWAPRALHTTLVFRDKLWVVGGQTMPAFGGGPERFYRDAWTSTDGSNWTEVSIKEPCWSPRGMIGGAAVKDGRIWILGGGTYDTPTTPHRNFYNDVWSSPDGRSWTRHTPQAPWAARQYHDVAVFDDRLWVLEGYSGANRNDAWYSLDGVNWYEVPGTPWASRHAASVYVFQGGLWMVAGNNMESDVWKLVRTNK